MDKEDKVRDVVCGMIKTKDKMPFTSIFGGQTFYFCSEMDKQMFDAYPDRWATGGEREVK